MFTYLLHSTPRGNRNHKRFASLHARLIQMLILNLEESGDWGWGGEGVESITRRISLVSEMEIAECS